MRRTALPLIATMLLSGCADGAGGTDRSVSPKSKLVRDPGSRNEISRRAAVSGCDHRQRGPMCAGHPRSDQQHRPRRPLLQWRGECRFGQVWPPVRARRAGKRLRGRSLAEHSRWRKSLLDHRAHPVPDLHDRREPDHANAAMSDRPERRRDDASAAHRPIPHSRGLASHLHGAPAG